MQDSISLAQRHIMKEQLFKEKQEKEVEEKLIRRPYCVKKNQTERSYLVLMSILDFYCLDFLSSSSGVSEMECNIIKMKQCTAPKTPALQPPKKCLLVNLSQRYHGLSPSNEQMSQEAPENRNKGIHQ